MSSSPADPVRPPQWIDTLLAGPVRRRMGLGIVVAMGGTVVVTSVSSLLPRVGTALPAILYLLTVVAAAAVGGLWAGLLGGVLTSLGLNFFFTPPERTFRVSKAEDLMVLALFLGVAVVVTAAVSRGYEQRAIALYREHQVTALYDLTSRLLSGTRLEAVLKEVAASVRRLHGLRACRVLVVDAQGVPVSEGSEGPMIGEALVVPMEAEGLTVGRIELIGVQAGGIAPADRDVLRTFAGQLALAVSRLRLADEVGRVRLEAETSRTRAALFSSVTHDLRTPLASITASASSLLEPGVPFSDEQRQELLRTILEEAERLNRLVGNLMDLSRFRAGALVPAMEAVPLDELIASVLRRLDRHLVGRPLRVLVRDDLPPIPMDVVQIDQVVTNLIENAIRYTPGGTEIRIAATRWEDAVEVRVADRGPGIPEAERELVFQEFYRKDVQDRRGGTGLGLAIARAIVAAHGGVMWIETTAGGGTTVGFRLPLSRTARSADLPLGSTR